jgi:hypothetical protein
MSKSMERMLRKMVVPNADLRYTAPQAMLDPFWDYRKTSATTHSMDPVNRLYAFTQERILGRSSSYTSSVVFEKDMLKLMNTTPPWGTKEGPLTPPGLSPPEGKPAKERAPVPQLTKSKSQPKVAAAKCTLFQTWIASRR